MVHKKHRIARRCGQQPHGRAEALVHRRVNRLLDAPPVLRVFGVGVALA
jgi:hypothetical protein